MEGTSKKNTIQVSESLKEVIEILFPNDFKMEKNPVQSHHKVSDIYITGYFLKHYEQEDFFNAAMKSNKHMESSESMDNLMASPLFFST